MRRHWRPWGWRCLRGALAGEAVSQQVEPIVQESEAPSREGGETSMARESGPFTADTAIEDVQSWIDELGL